MGNATTKTEEGNIKVMEPHMIDSTGSSNIIENHDFSHGLKFWKPNCCHGSVVTSESCPSYLSLSIAHVPGKAWNKTFQPKFLQRQHIQFLHWTKVCKGNREKIEGTFSLSTMPKRHEFRESTLREIQVGSIRFQLLYLCLPIKLFSCLPDLSLCCYNAIHRHHVNCSRDSSWSPLNSGTLLFRVDMQADL